MGQTSRVRWQSLLRGTRKSPLKGQPLDRISCEPTERSVRRAIHKFKAQSFEGSPPSPDRGIHLADPTIVTGQNHSNVDVGEKFECYGAGAMATNDVEVSVRCTGRARPSTEEFSQVTNSVQVETRCLTATEPDCS